VTKRSAIILFTALNILFIGAQLYKHARMIDLTTAYHSGEKKLQELDHTIEALHQKICAHKNVENIKQYAQDVLHMKPLSLTKVKRINV